MALDSTLNYWVARSGQTFGPYTADEVMRYVDSGNIASSDHLRSERDIEWLTVAESLAIEGQAPAPLVATAPDDVARGLAVTSMALGIVGIFAFMCVPCVLNLAGLVIAILVVSRNDDSSRKLALASVFVNLFGLLAGIAGAILALGLIIAMGQAAGGPSP
jgi:thiol:disulfide interchange protein